MEKLKTARNENKNHTRHPITSSLSELNSQHRKTLKLWYVWFAGREIWKLVNVF